MSATLEKLVNVRSALVEDLMAYYQALISTLDSTPWSQAGRARRKSEVAIDARVFKEQTQSLAETIGSYFDGHGGRLLGDSDNSRHALSGTSLPEMAVLNSTSSRRRSEVAWKDEMMRVERAVIIGVPGGGKSFLTAMTAIALAEEGLALLSAQRTLLTALPLPIYLHAATYAQLESSGTQAEALLSMLRQQYALSPRLIAWMEGQLSSPNCWLILDALDEVSRDDMPKLSAALLALEAQKSSCRVLLTCRVANYAREQIPWTTLTEYELAPFRSKEIHQFIAQWFGAEERLAQTLRQTLDNNLALDHVCRTPLVATLTCLAHTQDPLTAQTRRVDLYRRVLRGLVRRAWKENPLPPQDAYIDDTCRLLEQTARRLFQSQPDVNHFSNTAIIEAIGTFGHLPEPLKLRKLFESLSPEQLLSLPSVLRDEQFLSRPSMLREEWRQAGILLGAGVNRKGEGQVSFLHHTYLEYLVACDLAHQADQKGWVAIEKLIDKKAWLPSWQEVIILLASQLDDPLPLLELLADEREDDYFRHRLALAALCLPEISATHREQHAKIVDKITTDLFRLCWEHKRRNTLIDMLMNMKFAGFAQVQVPSALAKRGLLFQEPPLPNLLISSLRAASVVGLLGEAAATPAILGRLVDLLAHPEKEVCLRAAEVVGQLGEAAATPAILGRLAGLLAHPEKDVRSSAVEAVAKFGEAAATDLILERLAGLLADPEKDVRLSAAKAVAQFGEAAATPLILERLAGLLADPKKDVRLSAAEAIGQFGEAAATDFILERLADLQTDPEKDMRFSAAEAIGKLGKAAATDGVLVALIALLADESEWVRSAAADAVGKLGEGTATDEDVQDDS